MTFTLDCLSCSKSPTYLLVGNAINRPYFPPFHPYPAHLHPPLVSRRSLSPSPAPAHVVCFSGQTCPDPSIVTPVLEHALCVWISSGRCHRSKGGASRDPPATIHPVFSSGITFSAMRDRWVLVGQLSGVVIWLAQCTSRVPKTSQSNPDPNTLT